MIVDILDEHLEEVEILADRRRDALQSVRFDLETLARLERRLLAHLEGLGIGMERGWRGLDDLLAARDPNRVFAAAASFMVGGQEERVLLVLDAVPPEGIPGMIEALCFVVPSDRARRRLETWLGSGDERRARVALEVLSFHRWLEPRAIDELAGSSDGETRKAAARAAGRVATKRPAVDRLAADVAPDVRDLALTSALRHGDLSALEALRAACRDPGACTPRALALLGVVGEARDIEVMSKMVPIERLAEAALAALGTLGFPEAVPRLLDSMSDPLRARGAGAAFARISGIEIRDASRGSEDSEVEDATFHDLRPVPDPKAVRAGWQERSSEFDPRARWRNGRRLGPDDWKRAPHGGDLLTRREELVRLWSREPDLYRGLELDAPSERQRRAA